MATVESLNQEIAERSALFNDARKQGADAAIIEEHKVKLGELKRALGQLMGASGSKDAKKKDRLLLKTAKGTRDFGPGEMHCREHIERIVKECFTTYGGSCIDTPVFERKDILTGKYGEDSKLIFDLKDQGGEELSLRYDHTVPLARYLAMNGAVTQAKLWQVGKVYRRDNPVMSKGRMREFSQADFDIAGLWDTMIPDAEVLSLVCTILTRLEVGDFTIKVNHRKILDGIFAVCGVPPEKIRAISSAVDKLDKLPWAEVKEEMTTTKGLDPAIADKIGEYVKHKGGPALLDILRQDSALMTNESAKTGIEEMGLLFTYLEAYDVLPKISFDMSLARGLDYYTGIIYEAVTEASAPPGFNAANTFASGDAPNSASAPAPVQKKKSKKAAKDDEDEEVDESQVGVGSIAAGGRYDNLVSMFTAAAAAEGKKAAQLPCVGISFGLDRIFAILWPKWTERGMRSKDTMAYVIAMGDGLLTERVRLVKELREGGIKTDFLFKNKPKREAQFAAGERDEARFAIILGADELKKGLVRVKEQNWDFVDGKKHKIENSSLGIEIKRAELVDWLKSTPVYQNWSTGKLL